MMIIQAEANSLFNKLNAIYPDHEVPLLASSAGCFEHF
jgi:hypothetical protein